MPCQYAIEDNLIFYHNLWSRKCSNTSLFPFPVQEAFRDDVPGSSEVDGLKLHDRFNIFSSLSHVNSCHASSPWMFCTVWPWIRGMLHPSNAFGFRKSLQPITEWFSCPIFLFLQPSERWNWFTQSIGTVCFRSIAPWTLPIASCGNPLLPL